MKTVKPEVTPIKMTYDEIAGFEFSTTMQKIAAKETTNKNACHIHRIIKALTDQRKKIHDEFQTKIVDVYAPKGEDGKAKMDPNGGFQPAEDKVEEFHKAQEQFGKTEFELNVLPLTPSVLVNHQLSAQDLSLLGPLFIEEEETKQGPGVPHLASV